MEWRDRGLVLGARRHGEAAAILEAMTKDHGRHLGLVHGARSRTMRPVLQAGNSVALAWRARLDEQLGSYQVEPETVRTAGILASPAALAGVGTVAAHLRLLPERDPHPELFAAADRVCAALSEGRPEAAAHLALFELRLLGDLGFGLDLSTCAATGRRDDLAFVSPRTGRAVGREAGAPYRDRLLPLPGFLVGDGEADPAGVAAAFRTLGHFLETRAYGPRVLPLPDERPRFVATLAARENEPETARPARIAGKGAGDSARDEGS